MREATTSSLVHGRGNPITASLAGTSGLMITFICLMCLAKI